MFRRCWRMVATAVVNSLPLLVTLVCSVTEADAMTSQEFDTYWVGGPILPSGRSTNIVHPRLFTTEAQADSAVLWAQVAGSLNLKGLTRLNTWFNSNSSGRPSPYGNTEQNECLTLIYDVRLAATKHTDNATNRGYAAACSTCFGIMVDGQPDDPLIAGSQYLAPFECNWPANHPGGLECGGRGRVSSTAYAYDFMAGLNPVTGQTWANAARRRRAIRALATSLLTPAETTKGVDSGGSLLQWTDFHVLLDLAIYGDSADAALNALIKADALVAINQWERAAACWQAADSAGVQEQYHQVRHQIRLAVARTIQLCFPGYSSPMLASQAIRNGGLFYRFTTRSDTWTDQQGVLKNGLARGPDKFNNSGWDPLWILSMHGRTVWDKRSWYLANYLGGQDWDMGPSMGFADALFLNNPSRYTGSVSFSDFERYFWDSRFGYFGMRSGWSNPGASNTDVVVLHWPQYLSAAGHLSAGSWSQNRGGDVIVQPRGLYKTDLEDHFAMIYAQSNSENTIGTWQTGESFDSFTVYDNGSSPDTCGNHHTYRKLSIGGQQMSGASSGITACENAGASRPELYTRGYGRGYTVDATTGVYNVKSDLTQSYGSSKQTYTRRSFFADVDGDVIVWDQTLVGSNVRYQGQIFSTPNAPQNQTGTITTKRGGGISGAADSVRVDSDGGAYGDSHGGIYKISGNTIAQSASAGIKMVSGSSNGWFFPLEIKNTTQGTNGYLVTIGGPSKTGVHWAQSKWPCADGYAAGNGTAFDSWVWDASGPGGSASDPNFGPLNGWNAAPGSYAAASGCPQLCADGGDAKARRKIGATDKVQSALGEVSARNNPPGGKGKASLDWVTYLLCETPSSGDLIETILVSAPRATATTMPTVKYAKTAQIVAVQIDSKLDVFPSASSASRLTSMTFTNPAGNTDVTVRVAGLAHATTFDLYHNTGSGLTDTGINVTSTAEGTAKWSHTTDSVSQFKLQIGSGGSGACCHPDGTCTVVAVASCTDTYQGDGTTCSPNPCPAPTGACCQESGDCFVSTEASCNELIGTYQGNATTCSPNPCSAVTGACCANDGTCTAVDNGTDCDALGAGHLWQGAGTTCSPNPCAVDLTGACCYSQACYSLPSATCAIAGGTFLGIGTPCSPEPCASNPLGACCYSGQTCTVYTRAECDAISGLWLGEATVCDPLPCPPEATAPSLRGRRGSGFEPGIGPTQTIGGVR